MLFSGAKKLNVKQSFRVKLATILMKLNSHVAFSFTKYILFFSPIAVLFRIFQNVDDLNCHVTSY